jgi:hypothetical protein
MFAAFGLPYVPRSEPCVLEQACSGDDGEFAEAAIQAKVRRLATEGFVYHWLLWIVNRGLYLWFRISVVPAGGMGGIKVAEEGACMQDKEKRMLEKKVIQEVWQGRSVEGRQPRSLR